MNLKKIAKECNETATSKGWWDIPFQYSGIRTFGDLCALLHSEVSEAYEDFRSGKSPVEFYYEPDGKPCGIPVELADIIIRLLDNCEHFGIDIERALREKMAYNKKRPRLHGGKRA